MKRRIKKSTRDLSVGDVYYMTDYSAEAHTIFSTRMWSRRWENDV